MNQWIEPSLLASESFARCYPTEGWPASFHPMGPPTPMLPYAPLLDQQYLDSQANVNAQGYPQAYYGSVHTPSDLAVRLLAVHRSFQAPYPSQSLQVNYSQEEVLNHSVSSSCVEFHQVMQSYAGYIDYAMRDHGAVLCPTPTPYYQPSRPFDALNTSFDYYSSLAAGQDEDPQEPSNQLAEIFAAWSPAIKAEPVDSLRPEAPAAMCAPSPPIPEEPATDSPSPDASDDEDYQAEEDDDVDRSPTQTPAELEVGYESGDYPELPRRTPNKRLPTKAVIYLKKWLLDNALDPYPSDAMKDTMQQVTGLSLKQISNWFINARRRYLPRNKRRIKRSVRAPAPEPTTTTNLIQFTPETGF